MTTKPVIVLAGHDAAPSGCFKRFGPELEKRGFEVVLFIDHGKPRTSTDEQIAAAVSRAQLVILGTSSTAELAATELVAGRAAVAGKIPIVFYFDVRTCWTLGNKWYHELAPSVIACLGVEPSDPAEAQRTFPNARFFGTGNPLHGEMALPPKFPRDEVRAKLGLQPDEVAVMLTTVKSPGCNLAQLELLIRALEILQNAGRKIRLLVSPHPGDRTPFAVDPGPDVEELLKQQGFPGEVPVFLTEFKAFQEAHPGLGLELLAPKPMNLYQELASHGEVKVEMVPPNVFRGGELLPAVECLVEYGSSLALQAACMEEPVPVVTLAIDLIVRRHARTTGVTPPASPYLEAQEEGLSLMVRGSDAQVLAETIVLALEGNRRLKENQRRFRAGIAAPGTALAKMVEVIQRFLPGD